MRSAVAGILGPSGGVRIVVTQPWLFYHHVGKDERLFVLPKVLVQEPLSIAQAAPMIEAVKQYVEANK